MRSSMWLNAALAVIVAALGAFLYLRPASDSAVEHPLSALKPQEALSLRIERAGAVPVVLDRKQDTWFITAPIVARADESRVQQVLAIVEARSAHRLPADDRGRFGLEAPQARVIVDGQPFSLGLLNEITREQYVMSGDAVYAVHPRYGAALPVGAVQMASRRLFGPGEAPARIALKDFTVEQREGKWTLAPGTGELSQDDLIRWVDEWRLASALSVEPRSAARARDEIRIQLKSGGGFTLGVIAREPELVLARSDEVLQYRFGAALAKRLLSPPLQDEGSAKK
ncbi:MAG: DUF4340 domain-containing protein [Burkholderiales bacterium]